jgi:hypothetical protein
MLTISVSGIHCLYVFIAVLSNMDTGECSTHLLFIIVHKYQLITFIVNVAGSRLPSRLRKF